MHLGLPSYLLGPEEDKHRYYFRVSEWRWQNYEINFDFGIRNSEFGFQKSEFGIHEKSEENLTRKISR